MRSDGTRSVVCTLVVISMAAAVRARNLIRHPQKAPSLLPGGEAGDMKPPVAWRSNRWRNSSWSRDRRPLAGDEEARNAAVKKFVAREIPKRWP